MSDGPNIPLLRKVVEWAESEEKLELAQARRWNQMHWFIQYDREHEDYQDIECGTAYCIAGFIAIELEGWKPVIPRLTRPPTTSGTR